jgi:hypothetical protein
MQGVENGKQAFNEYRYRERKAENYERNAI